MKKKIWQSILISILGVGIAGGMALLFTDTDSSWYQSLIQPSIQPPPTVFAIAWSVIYLIYAASLALAIINDSGKKTYFLYLIQGMLNIAWCLFYFKFHLPAVALISLIAYIIVGFICLKEVFKSSKISAYLLIPCQAWLVFAALLNVLTIILN